MHCLTIVGQCFFCIFTDMKNFYCKYRSFIGDITLASDGENLTGLWFDGQQYYADTLSADSEECDDLELFGQTRRWLDIYFSGGKPDFTPPIRLNDTPFRMMVWEILQKIPYGATTTYKEIAVEVAHRMGIVKMSAQAVGGAIGRNPVSIIIPCHRVVGSDGRLVGYAGGLDKKSALLSIEKP